MRPDVTNKSTGNGFVNIAYTWMKKHVVFNVKDLKKMVTNAGGNTTASLPFLNDTSRDTVLKPSTNGKQRKCFQIPHSSLSDTIVDKLINRGKNFKL